MSMQEHNSLKAKLTKAVLNESDRRGQGVSMAAHDGLPEKESRRDTGRKKAELKE